MTAAGRPALSSARDLISGAGRAELVLVRALVFFRVGGLIEVASVLMLDARHYRSMAPVLTLAGAVAAESVLLILAARRRGEVSSSLVSADVAFLVGCLAVGARLTAAPEGHTWAYFMYPFSVITCFAIGIGYARLRNVMAVTTVLAGGYGLSAIEILHDAPWNVMPNAATYFGNAVVTWAIAREYRRSARSADASRAAAITHAEELAQERERARHARLLHDHVLQTLESLTRCGSIASDEMRSHIAAEAAWLRALVEGVSVNDEGGDLLSRLQRLVEQRTAAGLRIEFNHAQLRASTIRRNPPRHITEAVVDATREALTNVAKHGGVNVAVVRATATDGGLTVSVLDQGVGFDPERTARGIGLEKSITSRIREIGGSVRIESAVGAGTYVELSVPSAAWHRPAVRLQAQLLPAAGPGGRPPVM